MIYTYINNNSIKKKYDYNNNSPSHFWFNPDDSVNKKNQPFLAISGKWKNKKKTHAHTLTASLKIIV
jgi:hypothetical protein